MTEELKEKLVGVANDLIDRMVEEDGIYWTLDWLLYVGHLTGEELLELGFDLHDVRDILTESPQLDPTWVNYTAEEEP